LRHRSFGKRASVWSTVAERGGDTAFGRKQDLQIGNIVVRG
jgi:hypothetical protein